MHFLPLTFFHGHIIDLLDWSSSLSLREAIVPDQKRGWWDKKKSDSFIYCH